VKFQVLHEKEMKNKKKIKKKKTNALIFPYFFFIRKYAPAPTITITTNPRIRSSHGNPPLAGVVVAGFGVVTAGATGFVVVGAGLLVAANTSLFASFALEIAVA